MAVVDELLAIGEEDRRKKQFLQDNPLFGMEPYHEVRPTYSNRYTETLGSLLEPLMTKSDAGPLDLNFWTGLLSTPLVKSMRPREEPTKMEYAFSGVPFTPGLGVAPSLAKTAAKRFIPEFDPSRRTFLKTSATVGALTGLGIGLGKKIATKTAGAMEGLGKELSDLILGSDSMIDVNSAFRKFEGIGHYLGNIRQAANDLQLDYTNIGKGKAAEWEDLDSLQKMEDHIGIGDEGLIESQRVGDAKLVIRAMEEGKPYGHTDISGVIGNEYKQHVKWADELDWQDVPGIHDQLETVGLNQSPYDYDLAVDDITNFELNRHIKHEGDRLGNLADNTLWGTRYFKNTINRLNHLEKTDPELFIKLLDEQIEAAKKNARVHKTGRSGVKLDFVQDVRDAPSYRGAFQPERSKRLPMHGVGDVRFSSAEDALKQLMDIRSRVKLPDKPKPKKKDDVSIVQRVLDPLGYTRMKAPYEK